MHVAPSLALVLALLASPSAHAFSRDLSPEGVPRAWRTAPPAPRLVGDLPGLPDAQRDLDDAFGAWITLPHAPLPSAPDAATTFEVVPVLERWPHDPAFVAHTTVVDGRPPGTLVAARIELNATHHRFCRASCAPGEIPLAPVLLHELGHALGLGHSGVRGTVMAPGLGARSGHDAPTTLTADDRRGFSAIYGTSPQESRPAPSPSSPSSPPSRWWALVAPAVLGVVLAVRRRPRRATPT